MEKYDVSGEFDLNYCLIKGDRAEIWGQNISSNPNREYSPVKVQEVSREEALRLAAEHKAARAAERAAREAEETRKKAREEKLASLAGEYHGLTLNKYGEVMDRFYNYLFSLPREIPDDVGQWIKKTYVEYLEAGVWE